MPLSVFAITNAKPKAKGYKLADGNGLHLLIQPNGNRFWRFRYRFAGVEKMLALGSFPATTIADARRKRDAARSVLEKGMDPAVQRQLDKLATEAAAKNTFGVIADEFVEGARASGAAAVTLSKKEWLLKSIALPLRHRPICEITPMEVLGLLKRVEQSGRRETAKRLRATIGAVFRLAIVTERAKSNPSEALRGALLRPNVRSRAAITTEKEFGALLRCIDNFDGWITLKAALQFSALTFARPGEVRGAKRTEFDLERGVWRIGAERMKMRRSHEVPLSHQALAVLREIWSVSEHGELVFPSIRSNRKPLSENAMNSALRRMGYTQDEMTSHGFRSSASTILNERGYNPDVIEAALGHQHNNAIRRAYNRASYWPERIKLMQEWADMLDAFRAQRSNP